MAPEKKPLRLFDPIADVGRSGWYQGDLFYCVCCRYDGSEGVHIPRIPRGAPVFYAGLSGLFYCVKHAPTDALGAPAHTEELSP